MHTIRTSYFTVRTEVGPVRSSYEPWLQRNLIMAIEQVTYYERTLTVCEFDRCNSGRC